MTLMKQLLNQYGYDNILDVGSQDVNGSYRSLLLPEVRYTGLDMAAGKGVDIVTKDPYNWPVLDDTYSTVISGQCLEHVEAPWLWIKEVHRVLKPGGYAIIIAPYACGIHRYPVDCWRILPDGMSFLLKWAGFKDVEFGNGPIIKDLGDCFGVGRK
jgi:SAM-dependent methyltransferase